MNYIFSRSVATVFFCEIMQPAAFICVICDDLRYLRENNTQEDSSYLCHSRLLLSTSSLSFHFCFSENTTNIHEK